MLESPSAAEHTALTNLSGAGCDAFTLARIAGHSSIQITMRYCYPQADAIESALCRWPIAKNWLVTVVNAKKRGVEGEAESPALTLTVKRG